MNTPALILAAGGSRRLGHPKQLVLVDGETLLGRTLRVAREAGADPILVVLGGNRESIEEEVDFSRAQPVQNEVWEQGIASSIHAGIEALQAGYPEANSVLLLACDQPLLTAEHLQLLIETQALANEPIIVASRYKGIPGIPAIFPAIYFADLSRLRGDTGARHILRARGHNLVCVDFEGGEFDVDSSADLAALSERLAGKCQP